MGGGYSGGRGEQWGGGSSTVGGSGPTVGGINKGGALQPLRTALHTISISIQNSLS